MRCSAVVLAFDEHGRVLAISRPESPLRYALPGGGVDGEESYEQAARRELWEETGIVAPRLARVHADRCGDVFVVAFVALDPVTGSSGEGWARWVDPRVLTCAGAAWPNFARDVYQAAGLRLPRC